MRARFSPRACGTSINCAAMSTECGDRARGGHDEDPSGLLNVDPSGARGELDTRPKLLIAILIAVFVTAAGVRFYRLDATGMLVERDFMSAIIARDFYFSRVSNVEPWRRDLVGILRASQPIREPPVTEWLASLAYSAAGKEDIRYARLLTSFFWLAGGFFLYRITQSLVSTDGAVFALIYYLFAPMSVLLSRSFQPDALMMLLFLMSLYLIVQYHQSPSRTRLTGAVLATAVTLLVRPLVMFGLLGAFVIPLIRRRSFWRSVLTRESLIFASLSVMPSVAYYGYAGFVTRTLATQMDTSFNFHLFVHREYWKGGSCWPTGPSVSPSWSRHV